MTRGEIYSLYTDYRNFSINANYWNFRPFRRIRSTVAFRATV